MTTANYFRIPKDLFSASISGPDELRAALAAALIGNSHCVFKGWDFSNYLAVNLILPFMARRLGDMKIRELQRMAGAIIVTLDVVPPIDNLRVLLSYDEEGVSTLFADALDVSSTYHFTSPSASMYSVRNGAIQTSAQLNLKHDTLRLRVINASALAFLTASKENEDAGWPAKFHELQKEVAEHKRASGEREKEIAAREKEIADVREQLHKSQEVKHSLEERIVTQGLTIQTLDGEVERTIWVALGFFLAVILLLLGFVGIRRGRRYQGLIPSEEHREN